jgi:hypothetical protein
MSEQENAVKLVLDALFSGVAAKGKSAMEQVSEVPAVINARIAARSLSPETFYFSLPYELNQLVDAILEAELPGNGNAQFLMGHSSFVSNHLDSIFQKFEGSACSHDKTKTVMRALMRFFTTGEPISFNYDQEYTFGLPKKVLKSHDSIVQYINSLHHLYYGNSDHYLTAMFSIMGELAAANSAADNAGQ